MRTSAAKAVLFALTASVLAGCVSPEQIASYSEQQPGFQQVSSGTSLRSRNKETVWIQNADQAKAVYVPEGGALTIRSQGQTNFVAPANTK